MSRSLFQDISQLIVSLVLLAGCFGFLWGVYFSGHPIDPGSKESLTQVTGGVIGMIGTVAGFYLGTSLSSLRKDTTISQSVKKESP